MFIVLFGREFRIAEGEAWLSTNDGRFPEPVFAFVSGPGVTTVWCAMNNVPNREVEVFAAALQLLPPERADYLKATCAGDAELRERVERLLEAHDRAGNFLEQPPVNDRGETRPEASVGEKSGDRIGRYKILQQIGEGGCGVV